MSLRCKRFQVRMLVWLAFIFLSSYFGYTITGDIPDVFLKSCMAIAVASASAWWLWMMQFLDKLESKNQVTE